MTCSLNRFILFEQLSRSEDDIRKLCGQLHSLATVPDKHTFNNTNNKQHALHAIHDMSTACRHKFTLHFVKLTSSVPRLIFCHDKRLSCLSVCLSVWYSTVVRAGRSGV